MAIIVGDIHGCVEKVTTFLSYKPEVEHIALGDYPDSFREPQERQIEALQLLLESDAVLLWEAGTAVCVPRLLDLLAIRY